MCFLTSAWVLPWKKYNLKDKPLIPPLPITKERYKLFLKQSSYRVLKPTRLPPEYASESGNMENVANKVVKDDNTGNKFKVPLKEQVFSTTFILLIIANGIMVLRSNFVGGAMFDILSYLGDTGEMVMIYNWMLPAGGLGGCVLFALEKIKPKWMYLLLFICGILFGTTILIPNPLELQYLTMVIFCPFRPILFGVLYYYVSYIYGFTHYGSLIGIAMVVAGCFNSLSFLFIYLAFSVFNGDFFVVNLILLGLQLPVIIWVIYLFKGLDEK